MSTVPRKALLGLGLALTALLANAGLTIGNLHGLVAVQREVTRSHQLLVELERLDGTLKDAEAAQVRFLMTEGRSSLVPYETARNVLSLELQRLGELVEGDERQTARLGELAHAVRQQQDRLADGIRLVRAGRREEALSDALVPTELPARSGVRDAVEALEDAERRALSAREAEARRRRFAAVSSSFASLLLRSDLAARADAAAALELSNSSLRDADRKKDEFLVSLAHELRNPLAAMRSAVDLLEASGSRAGEATPPRRTLASAVLSRQLSHVTRLVDDLLDLSRVTSARVVLRKEAVALSDVVEAALETTRPAIEARSHALAVKLPEESVVVEGDPVRLAQVVSNLLTNAAKYATPGGRIALEVAADDAEAVVRVTDDGIGLAPEDLERVFGLFEQGPGGQPHPDGGLGVGLALARRLAQLHGGSLSAESPGPGLGSTFTLRLPRQAAPQRGAPRAAPAAPPGGPPRRVLVVDDNADAAAALAELLSISGHDVRLAADGGSGLEAAREHRPDVVVLDLGLPGPDGYEVARRLRDEPGLEGAVLIALSGWARPEDRRRAVEAGFDHYLVKPVGAARLKELLAAGPGPQRR